MFEEWVQELDQKFSSEGRSVVLVKDYCPANNLVFLTTKHHTNNTAYGSRHSKIIKRIVRIWFKRPSEVERKTMPCQKFRS